MELYELTRTYAQELVDLYEDYIRLQLTEELTDSEEISDRIKSVTEQVPEFRATLIEFVGAALEVEQLAPNNTDRPLFWEAWSRLHLAREKLEEL